MNVIIIIVISKLITRQIIDIMIAIIVLLQLLLTTNIGLKYDYADTMGNVFAKLITMSIISIALISLLQCRFIYFW